MKWINDHGNYLSQFWIQSKGRSIELHKNPYQTIKQKTGAHISAKTVKCKYLLIDCSTCYLRRVLSANLPQNAPPWVHKFTQFHRRNFHQCLPQYFHIDLVQIWGAIMAKLNLAQLARMGVILAVSFQLRNVFNNYCWRKNFHCCIQREMIDCAATVIMPANIVKMTSDLHRNADRFWCAKCFILSFIVYCHNIWCG